MDSDCLSGTITPQHGTGKEIKLADMNVYLAEPAQPTTKVLILATDVFGWKLSNIRVIADRYAAEGGYKVLIPEILIGSFPQNLPDLMKELTLPSTPAERKKEINRFKEEESQKFFAANPMSYGEGLLVKLIRHLREEKIASRVAIQGYCWGGGLAVKIAGKPGHVEAIIAAHPSRVSIPAEIEQISCPSCFLLAEIDQQISKELSDQILVILERKKQKDSSLEYVHRYFLGVAHGWAVRGSEDDPHVVKAREEAFQESLAFLSHHLS